MLRHSGGTWYGQLMMSSATLKTETATLCVNIGQLQQKLGRKTIAFDDAHKLWDTVYKPKARSLAAGMLSYVPSDDPKISGDPTRLIIEGQSGTQYRYFKPDSVACIEEIFSERLASHHLSTVVNQLHRLTDYLSAEAEA
jgi:hypothetical protein